MIKEIPLDIRITKAGDQQVIGLVRVDLNALLIGKKTHAYEGWLPIYNFVNGIQGEIYVEIKLQ